MNKTLKTIIVGICIIIIGLASYAIIAKISQTDEARIKRIIYAAKNATEKENIIKCLSYVSFDYKDRYGNDKNSLFLIGQRVFSQYDRISILIQSLNIAVEKDLAQAEIMAIGYAKNVQASNIEYDEVKFTVSFRKEKNDWKVIELNFIEPKDFPVLIK